MMRIPLLALLLLVFGAGVLACLLARDDVEGPQRYWSRVVVEIPSFHGERADYWRRKILDNDLVFSAWGVPFVHEGGEFRGCLLDGDISDKDMNDVNAVFRYLLKDDEPAV